MNDEQRKARWAKVTSPLEAIHEALAHQHYLGTDPYYKDMNDAILAMLERVGQAVPVKPCDGTEQEVFEAWAKDKNFAMGQHPMFYIFMDQKTNAARLGWNEAIRYVNEKLGIT